MPGVFNEGWYDQNADRNYPLIDGAGREATSSSFLLPNNLLVDARLFADPAKNSLLFNVLSLTAYGTGLIITIGYNGVAAATCTIPNVPTVAYQAYAVVGLPGFEDVSGQLVVGDAAGVLAASSGVYTFLLAQTQLLPTVVVPSGTGVAAITVVDSFGVSTRLTGEIILVAGPNAVVEASAPNITVGLTSGVLINDPCGCTDGAGVSREPIRSINGVGPDANGNLELVPGLSCLTLTPGTNALLVQDTCAQPCCGTAEMTALEESVLAITENLRLQAQGSATLEQLVRSLQGILYQ